MKTFLIIAGASLLAFFLFIARKPLPPIAQPVQDIRLPDLNIVLYQDVSESIKEHGVEIISSEIFRPYFFQLDRNINIYFGVIADSSAKKLVHLSLPARSFKKPVPPNYSTGSIVHNRTLKEQFLRDEKKFIEDSIVYFKDRNIRIQHFCYRVDSVVTVYRNKLTNQTDLSTAISVAERVFNFPNKDSTLNFLLLNSDGKDSFGKSVKKIKANAEVVLINASGLQRTSIDKIITITLESPEQAILYTLRN